MTTKYSKFKIFNFKDKLNTLTKDSTKIKAPIHIRIKPTNVCNHSCWYCSYQSLDNIQLGKDMIVRDVIPREKMLSIIDDCIEMGVKAITFSGGGEPLLYPHLLEVVKKLSKSDIKFATLTNGSKLKGELAEVFAKYGQWVRISIDGWDDKSYSEYRNVKQTEFAKVIGNMKKFVEIKDRKCNIGISFIIDNKNYTHIYEFSKLMKDIGIDSIKLSPCVVDNNAVKNNEYHKSIYTKAKNLCIEAQDKLGDSTFEVFDSYHLLESKFSKSYDWCPYIQINPIIGADMRVYTCHDKAYNLETGNLGSIKDISFKEFWMNDKDKFYNTNPSKHCNHHCSVNDKNKIILDYLNIDDNHIDFV